MLLVLVGCEPMLHRLESQGLAEKVAREAEEFWRGLGHRCTPPSGRMKGALFSRAKVFHGVLLPWARRGLLLQALLGVADPVG